MMRVLIEIGIRFIRKRERERERERELINVQDM